MKKSLVALIMVVFCTSISSASIFVDLGAGYFMAGDAENQMGGSLGVGFSVHRDANFIVKSTYSTAEENVGDPDETTYTHITGLFGVEYTPYIPQLEKYRLSWNNQFLIGYSQTEFDDKSKGKTFDYSGPAVALWTGIRFDATQTFSPFLNIGYHYSMYDEDETYGSVNVQGFQIELGVRCYFGNSRDFRRDY